MQHPLQAGHLGKSMNYAALAFLRVGQFSSLLCTSHLRWFRMVRTFSVNHILYTNSHTMQRTSILWPNLI